MDKGLDTAHHFTPVDGWTPGDLDFFTVPQRQFNEEEHQVWQALYKRMLTVLPGRAIDMFMDSLSTLGINQGRIPRLDEVNEILMKRTGWQVVTVPGLIPDEPFFELLANRRFPLGNFIRGKDQLDYIQEPDIFHDLFGHVPLLADPTIANFIEAYGNGGLRAAKLGTLDKLARLYWYTIEFGLIEEPKGLRIYGAGILSSPVETVFALENPSPNRVGFDLKRVLQTHFRIDDFQETYFVVDSLKQLFDETSIDFAHLYKELAGQPEHAAGAVLAGDKVYHKGTGAYAAEAEKKRKDRSTAS